MQFDTALSRKEFLRGLMAATAAGAMAPRGAAQGQSPPSDPAAVTADDLKVLEKVFAIEFTDEERAALVNSVRGARRGFENIRTLPIDYTVEPPTPFSPLPGRSRVASAPRGVSVRPSPPTVKEVPKGEELAFQSVRNLGELLRTRKVTSVQLTQLYLERLRRYGDALLCVVTLTPDLALKQAEQADAEIRAGKSRGPLHGIPCGVKDLLATKGIPTTWGADPYKDQVFDYDAAVVERLRDAGAVLVAKLSMGALAQGDVWFKGRTRNPWNPATGSSGSSAGSAAATAAGLVGFAIGTETLGSIVSPSHVCRVTGLRPTYGRVSRRGAMAVSWTMDKIGILCREVEDCALVFAAICGADPGDPSSVERPFHYDPRVDLSRLRIGYLSSAGTEGEAAAPQSVGYLKRLLDLGAKLEPVVVDPIPSGANLVLGVEASAAFDAFTRGDAIDELKNSAWPSTYRSNRYVPAVEYLQAQRARTLLQKRFEEQLGDVDVLVADERGGHTLFVTNLTGHPQVLVPNGTDDRGAARSVSFIGRLYEDDLLLAVARRFQETGDAHHLRPDLSKIGTDLNR
ncbi:MAG: amidase [Fimbriimonadaceae bacterium]|nr:amidase [Chthonomonadaceae bacterium]MCO5295338.1 amidase [Fimbriimonadaceae bacterium]